MHVGGICIFGILVVLMIANMRIYKKRQEYLVQAESLQKQINDIQQSSNNLKEAIVKENDPIYIEKVAREELDLQKQGEAAVSFIVSKPTQQKNPNTSENNLQGWFRKSWEWLRGLF